MIADADVERVADVARDLPPASGVYIEEDYVMNLLETVIDYQMHSTAVVKSLQFFRDNRWDELRTLGDLEAVLARHTDDLEGNTELATYLWGNRHWRRAHELRGLTAFFRDIGVTNQEELRDWGLTSEFEKDFQGRVKGLGRAIYQWLVMRLGVDTVKPDVHVRRFAESAVGRSLNDKDVVDVVTRAAHQLELKAYELDWRIWESARRPTPSPG